VPEPPDLLYLVSELLGEQLLDEVCLPVLEAELRCQVLRGVVLVHHQRLCLPLCHLYCYLKDLHL
jgi:hypothetical protein